MALKGMESWDIYDSANIDDYWQAHLGNIMPSTGRCGTSAFLSVALSNGSSIGVTTAVSSGYAAMAYKPIAFNALGQFLIGNTTGLAPGDTLGFMRVVGSGAVEMWKGPNTVLGNLMCSTATGVMNIDLYTHIGLEWKFDGSSGYMKIYINGLLAADSGLTNTLNIWSAGQWGTLGFFPLGYVDDLYWGDTTGASPQNGFFGDCHVEGQVVDTAGTYQQFTPSTGSDHVALVDEIPPDDGATYVSSSTVAQKETFTFPDIIPLTGSVYGIQLMPNMVKTAFQTRTVRNIVRFSATDANGATQALAATNYKYYPEVFQINPVSSVAWTVTTTNVMEGGVEVVS